MKLTFIGAAHEVTGSCHCLHACGKNILIDYGMEQGQNMYENQDLPISPSDVDFVLLTHAHIDHSGLIPLLYARGFRGQILATKATVDLCDIMLRDSAHIQVFEAEWKNRKAKRSGNIPIEPLYRMEDALNVMKYFCPCSYNTIIKVCEGIKVRFIDVGHLLGSASIEIWITENGITKKIVFSGDIGNEDQPLINNPQYIDDADYVVMESTYGDRLHKKDCGYVEDLAEIITETFYKGGNVVIPSFAVGRTQEILYFIRRIKEERLVPFDNFEVYVDSPLAVEATNIFMENVSECYDEEAKALIEKGINPIRFPGLKLSITSEESKEINAKDNPKVIISASGMCEAGRIRHHLKHNLWREECTILFVGYQANGSLGRVILDGTPIVRLFGEEINVNARIERLDGISGHADKNGLIRWIESFKKKPTRVFVVHGENTVCESFADFLCREYGQEAVAPYSGASYDLATNQCLEEGCKILVKKAKEPSTRANQVFARLVAAGQRLLTVIRHNEGGANKDLGKFADQINALCDKWDR
ncbi:MAG: MBL fold metallo-hydrolase RNA specificity domain-containing protein [Lachnospiraceae bacterium]